MYKTVTIQNLQVNNDLPLCSDPIDPASAIITNPAAGKYTLQMEEYYELSIYVDQTKYPVKIIAPDMTSLKVSAKAFGCKGDGVSDDTDNLQRAIDFVSYHGGGVVEIPTGVFIISGIFVKGSVLLEGWSREMSVIKCLSDPISGQAVISFSTDAVGMSKLRIVMAVI